MDKLKAEMGIAGCGASHRALAGPSCAESRGRRGAWLLGALVETPLNAGRIEATNTFTAPLRNAEGNTVACVVQNHSDQNVAASAVLRDGSGADLEGNALMVGAGDLTALLFNNSTTTPSATPTAGSSLMARTPRCAASSASATRPPAVPARVHGVHGVRA